MYMYFGDTVSAATLIVNSDVIHGGTALINNLILDFFFSVCR